MKLDAWQQFWTAGTIVYSMKTLQVMCRVSGDTRFMRLFHHCKFAHVSMRLFHHCKLVHVSMRLFHHCKLAHVSMRLFCHCKCAHVSTTKIETVRLFYHYKWAHVSTTMTETVRLFYHYKWAHVSATRTSNRTSSLQVSTFPPTVGPRPEVVHGAIHLSPYISHHF